MDETYFLIFQHANQANQGNLRNKSNTLQWGDKIQMALDITCGLMCLHSENIIHGKLVNKEIVYYLFHLTLNVLLINYCSFIVEHAGNILVNNGRLMITDMNYFNLCHL